MQLDVPLTPTGIPRQLVLFTNGFPYGTGEEFLESEVPFLTDQFSQVLIVPLVNPKVVPLTRSLPPRVKLVVPEYELQKTSHIIYSYVARHPFRAVRALGRAILPFRSFSRSRADFAFFVMAELITDRTFGEIQDSLDPNLETVFYAYWLHAPAQVALTTRSRLGMRSARVVSRAHRYDLYDFPGDTNGLPARDSLLHRLHAIYPVSEDGREYLAARHPQTAQKVKTERLGVFAATNSGNPDLGAATLYSCSTFAEVKRLPLLISGIAEAQHRGVSVHWVHIGDGARESREELVRLAESRLAPGTWDFIGALANTDVRDRYALSPGTAFVNVSSSEGVPVSMMEALAQGMPLIATDVGGSSELISEKIGMFPGLLPASPTASEIADRIEAIFSTSPEIYRGFVDASVAHWADRWDAVQNYTEFSALLAGEAPPTRAK